jgi:hypothetical protein
MTPDVITSLASTLGVVGALVWYLYHNTTKTLPEIVKTYTESQEKQSQKFADTTDKISERFSTTLSDERNYRKQEIQALQAWIKSESSCKYNEDRRE